MTESKGTFVHNVNELLIQGVVDYAAFACRYLMAHRMNCAFELSSLDDQPTREQLLEYIQELVDGKHELPPVTIGHNEEYLGEFAKL